MEKFYFCLGKIQRVFVLSAESVSWSTEVLTLHSALYISNSAEPVSCIELFLKKVEVAAVGNKVLSPRPACLVDGRRKRTVRDNNVS